MDTLLLIVFIRYQSHRWQQGVYMVTCLSSQGHELIREKGIGK